MKGERIRVTGGDYRGQYGRAIRPDGTLRGQAGWLVKLDGRTFGSFVQTRHMTVVGDGITLSEQEFKVPCSALSPGHVHCAHGHAGDCPDVDNCTVYAPELVTIRSMVRDA